MSTLVVPAAELRLRLRRNPRPVTVERPGERRAAALALIHAGDVERLIAWAQRTTKTDVDWVAEVNRAYDAATAGER